MARIPILSAPQTFQRFAGARKGIIENWGRTSASSVVHRKQVVAISRIAIPNGAGDRLFVYIEMLSERCVEHLDDRNVEPIKPKNRVAARVAVIVPGPRRRNDEIALMHDRALTIDGRVGAFALENETQRGLGVTVSRRDLTGHDQLHAGVKIGRDLGLST